MSDRDVRLYVDGMLEFCERALRSRLPENGA